MIITEPNAFQDCCIMIFFTHKGDKIVIFPYANNFQDSSFHPQLVKFCLQRFEVDSPPYHLHNDAFLPRFNDYVFFSLRQDKLWTLIISYFSFLHPQSIISLISFFNFVFLHLLHKFACYHILVRDHCERTVILLRSRRFLFL